MIRRGLTLLLLATTWGCQDRYVETGDLPAIRERGRLRVAVQRTTERDRLPRSGSQIEFETELAASLARDLGLDPVFVRVDGRDELIPTLLDGRADLLAFNITVTEERSQRVRFSRPVGFVREQVVTRREDTTLTDPSDLSGREIAVQRSTSHWPTADSLRQLFPDLRIREVPADLDTDEILQRVAAGRYDIALGDDNLVAEALAYIPDLRVAFDVSGDRELAWAVRPNAPELLEEVNEFIRSEGLSTRPPTVHTGDLPTILEHQTLRVITRNNASTYFIWRGQLRGFEYDLARRFADRLGVRLEVLVPHNRAALLNWLEQGRGDIVAAGLTPNEERDEQVDFSRPYSWVIQTVVVRADDSTIRAVEDLEGRTVVVRRLSSYWKTAQEILESGVDFTLEAAPEDLETEQIIDFVARGEYDLTIADSHILEIELTYRDDVAPAITLGDSVPHAWAVRTTSTQLKDAIDRFFREEYRGLWFNLTYNKYFREPEQVEELATERFAQTGAISPYDSLVQHFAGEYGFDWRLIAAQMFEESHFNPRARSRAGALGLMQVLPRTGQAFGFDSLLVPEQSIEAGVKYLRHQYELINEPETEQDRLWFALASYNAGYGHVQDARHLARRLGKDPNRWFDEVESVMPLLARRDYHSRTRHGYCRCSEPVRYVRRIREKYQAYQELTG